MSKPAADLPRITLTSINPRRRITCNEQILADSAQALQLDERGYPPRLYFPWADVDAGLLQLSDKTTHCPYKGDTQYYHVMVGEQRLANAAWCYPAPIDTMQAIAGRVAFDHVLLESEDADD